MRPHQGFNLVLSTCHWINLPVKIKLPLLITNTNQLNAIAIYNKFFRRRNQNKGLRRAGLRFCEAVGLLHPANIFPRPV
ncbi:hypothetical protein ACLAH2_001439, partial [Escherichia coli]